MSAIETTPKSVELTERQIRAIELRKAGLSFHEIAQALGMSNASTASTAVREGLERWGTEEVDELRRLEMARLDHLTRRIWPKCIGRPGRQGGVQQDGTLVDPVEEVDPDLQYIRMYLRISDQRAKLVGMYAPAEVKFQHNVSQDPQITEDLSRFLELVDDVVGDAKIIDAEIVEDDGE
jgi:hypothetical protein